MLFSNLPLSTENRGLWHSLKMHGIVTKTLLVPSNDIDCFQHTVQQSQTNKNQDVFS